MDFDDEVNDPTYCPPKLTPKKRGMEIERLIGKTKSHCCNANLIPEKVNNPVTDFRCSDCNRGIQVKSTSCKNDPQLVVVTKPSEKGTCEQPITFYKILVKENDLFMKIFSPEIKKNRKVYYKTVKLNRWKQPMLKLLHGRITKPKKLNFYL